MVCSRQNWPFMSKKRETGQKSIFFEKKDIDKDISM